MKNILKKILPVSVINFIRRVRHNINVQKIKIKSKVSHYIYIQKMKAKLRSGKLQKKELSKISFEINVAEHCNLNCVGCMNFSCIAEPELVDIEEFKREFMRMGEIFNHECDRIYLIGGEPLLHPQINTLMKIARDNFTNGTIELFTNGILLTKMDSDFWRSCHDNDIGITVTAYPIKIGSKKIKELAQEFGVKFQWAWGKEEGSYDMFAKEAIDISGKGDPKLNFALCSRGNDCITLSHGRLYTCPFAAHVEHFNKKFGQNISITEDDYVNIYGDVSAGEILRKMASPIPACRYCRKKELMQFVKWGLSKREISEWV